MKNLFKILVGVSLLCATTIHAAILSTNLPSNGVFLLSTNRASVYSVELTAAANAQVWLFDSDSLAAPFYGTNYTNDVFTNRVTYPTNYVTSFVGYNGVTNWYTNSGQWTLSVSNRANTNQLSPLFSAVVAGATYAVYNTDALFARGVAVAVTGTNVGIVVNYRPAQ